MSNSKINMTACSLRDARPPGVVALRHSWILAPLFCSAQRDEWFICLVMCMNEVENDVSTLALCSVSRAALAKTGRLRTCGKQR